MYSRRDGVDPGRSRAGTSSASSGIWGRLSCAGWVVRVRVLRRALARGDLKRLQRFQEFVSVHVHLGTGVDNVVTDNVPSPWVRVKVYRPLDPGVPLTLAVACTKLRYVVEDCGSLLELSTRLSTVRPSPRPQLVNRVRLGADFGISPVRVLDAPDGEAGVLHRPVLLPDVPGLVHARMYTSASVRSPSTSFLPLCCRYGYHPTCRRHLVRRGPGLSFGMKLVRLTTNPCWMVCGQGLEPRGRRIRT